MLVQQLSSGLWVPGLNWSLRRVYKYNLSKILHVLLEVDAFKYLNINLYKFMYYANYAVEHF